MSEQTISGSSVVAAALTRLRAAADDVARGWLPAWRWCQESGSEVPIDSLHDVDLEPGSRQVLRARLEIPEQLHGVPLAGQPLTLRADGIFPIRVSIDGTALIDEGLPMVAAGPALLEALPRVHPGDNGELTLEIIRPASQGEGPAWWNWIGVQLSSPGLNQRFEQLDLAWARLRLATELASSEADQAALAAAAAVVPEQPLTLTEAELSAALEQVTTALAPLADRAAAIDAHVIGHCHIDLAWLWTWEETQAVITRDIRSVLDLMRDYPEMTFTHSQPAGYEVIRAEEPELFAQITEHIRTGRWEAATAQWVEGDTNLASGEAMASQLLEGVAYSREHLGVSPQVFLAPDTFGHAGNLPQLIADAGVRVYYHHRGNPGGRHGRWPAYWWEGIDGTRVLATSTLTYNGELTAGAIAEATIDAIRAGLSSALLFVGVGDHGGGPTRQGLDRLRQLGSAPGLPRSACSTLARYADAVLASGAQLPVHRGESPTIFEGCYTTHADAKKTNRDGENRLVTAETLAALADLPRDPELTATWRDLCFHQFHDILPGSAIPEVYQLTEQDHRRLVETTDRVVDQALEVLHAGAGGILVTNPLGHDRTDVVSTTWPDLADGTETVTLIDCQGRRIAGQVSDGAVLFVATVPAFGTQRYALRVTPAPASNDLAVQPEGGTRTHPGDAVVDENRYWRVQTPHFSAAVRQDSGIITSFVDKRVDRELVAWGMQRMSDYIDAARPDLGLNVFQLVEERPHPLSSWEYTEVHAEHSWVDGASVELVEAGPVRIVLRVRHAVRASTVTEDIIFYRDLARVDFVARVDWQEPTGPEHGVPNLKVSFATDLDECQPWFEIPYGATARRSNGQQVPALRWSDIGGSSYGVALVNDAVYGHDVLGTRQRLTLLRTASEPDPRSDQGEYTFAFSLVPHVGDWRRAGIPHLAAAANQPLIGRAVRGQDGAAVPAARSWQPRAEYADGVVQLALRRSRDGTGTVVRLSESAGVRTPVRLTGLPAGAQVWRASIVEDQLDVLGSGPEVAVTLAPWQVLTLIMGADR